MKILAFLQNMWFKDPERAKLLLERYRKHEGEEGYKERFCRDMLFMGCLTGRRLEKVFGEELCGYEGIIWAEAHPELGSHASSSFGYDAHHMAEVIRKHKPDVILAFGRIANDGLRVAYGLLGNLRNVPVIAGPHPAARGKTVPLDLQHMAEQLRAMMESK